MFFSVLHLQYRRLEATHVNSFGVFIHNINYQPKTKVQYIKPSNLKASSNALKDKNSLKETEVLLQNDVKLS